MKILKWLQSLFQTPEAEIDDRPLSSKPLHSKTTPKHKPLQSPQMQHIKKPNAYDRTVDAILTFLNAPENDALRQEILRDSQHLDLSISINKLQKAMQGKVSTTELLWHGRDFGEALYDALSDLREAAPPVTGEAGQMDVVLESVGDSKLAVVQTLRKLTSLDLKQTMDLVEKLPAVVMTGVPPAKATAAQSALEESGAQVSVRPTPSA